MYEPDVARNQFKAAKNLEFEHAAALRDQLKILRESVLISPV
jgi:excinuclease UvrABC helicase subunit UvrB